jgi:prepilin-type N-terminal cleavage/methylation domain-containing protein
MKKGEPGFTLAELLVSIAIIGVLSVVIGTVLFQMTNVSGNGNDELTIWHELQNVNSYLETDCQSALTASGGGSLTLTYPAGETVTYSRSGTNMLRTAGTTVNTLAQDIASLNFVVTGRLVQMDITSTVSGRTVNSEQISSLVSLRPTAP